MQAVAEEDTRVKSDVYTIVVEGPKTVAISQGGKEVTTTEVAKSKTSQTTTVQFSAKVKAADGTTYVNNEVTWTLTGNGESGTKLSSTGVLTVPIAEDPENTLTITATSKFDSNVSQTITVKLKSIFDGIEIGSTSTVTIDGTKFYVLAEDTSKAKIQYLIFATDPTSKGKFGSNWHWTKTCTAYTTLKTWLNGQPTLKAKAQQTTLYTRVDCTDYGNFNSDKYEIFLLSEADLFGTANGKTANTSSTTYKNEYSYPTKGRLTSNSTIIGFKDTTNAVEYTTGYWCWLRSPYPHADNSNEFESVAVVRKDAMLAGRSFYATHQYSLRPALWVNGL